MSFLSKNKLKVGDFEVELKFLNEVAEFTVTPSDYLVTTPTYGTQRILDARSYQPPIPFGRDFFRTYLLVRLSEEVHLFEQEFIGLRAGGWRLVATFRLVECSDESSHRELFFRIFDEVLPKLVIERPWEDRRYG